MRYPSRREFLQASSALLAASLAGNIFERNKEQTRLSYSTLGCPDWSFSQIVSFAARNAYAGIELRGIQHEMDLTKCREFSTGQNKKDTLALMKENGLAFSDLGSSASLHFADPGERKKNLDEACRFIDLARDIRCPYVRVFPNKFPPEQAKEATIRLIVAALTELGDYAAEKNVSVLMETHGDAVKTEDLVNIMEQAAHAHTGLVWDIANMWTITREPPPEVYQKLRKWIRHTHIKDARMVNNTPQYTLLGKGEVPIFEAIDALANDGYDGYYSFEWEKLWHPELAEPEIALADYPKAMQEHFR